MNEKMNDSKSIERVLCPKVFEARSMGKTRLETAPIIAEVIICDCRRAVRQYITEHGKPESEYLRGHKVRFACPEYIDKEIVVHLPRRATVPNVGTIHLTKADFHWLYYCIKSYNSTCHAAMALALITGDTIELPELAIRYVSPKDATPRKSGHQRVYNPNNMKFSIWK